MKLFPNNILNKLEFDKILHLLEVECLGELGKTYIQNLNFETEFAVIEDKLKQVNDMRISLKSDDPIPLYNYDDAFQDLAYLKIDGYVLSIESLQKIQKILEFFNQVFKYLNLTRQAVYPNLYQIIRHLSMDEGLNRIITKVIDKEGNIRSDASPELAAIRRKIVQLEREVDRAFKQVVQNQRLTGILTESGESIRNGRRVLALPVEHKRKIKGILHDESASGKTVYIEPEETVGLHNEIVEAEQEEKREIYKILKVLSEQLRPYSTIIEDYLRAIIQLDVIQSKARLALSMNANLPKLVDTPNIDIVDGYHPLLLLKNLQQGKKTINFTMRLLGDNRIVVLSGPNAGGKSITMKAVGLLQLMLQAGLLIPVNPISEMGIFSTVCADIGDQQSFEDELSTYSSRLQNARVFMENSDEQTLLLFDEFGSGTDPKMGGAIAESILKYIHEATKSWAIITTHFGNLKMFAFKTPGILNACMHFDNETLAPTYQFKIGRPGSSFAFEIAQKNGLQEEVLHYARKRVGQQENAVDELLLDLQREKQELEEKLEELNQTQRKLDRLVKSYDSMAKELDVKKKRLKLEIKEKDFQKTDDYAKKLEKVYKELKQQKSLEQTQSELMKLREERMKQLLEMEKLKDAVVAESLRENKMTAFKKGDAVQLRTSGATGSIESIDNEQKKAVVIIGNMTVNVKVNDLMAIKEPLERTGLRIKADVINENLTFVPKIDIRGLRMTEALKAVEVFVDKALINNSAKIEILHGKGDGTLRKAVKQKLREYKSFKNIFHPEQETGGDGITIVEL